MTIEGKGANTTTQAFEAIRGGLGDGQLLDALIARKSVHLPGLVAGLEAGLPGLADIEEALQRNAFPPDCMRMYSARKRVDLEKFRIVVSGRIQPQMVADAALMDTTFVFNGVEERIAGAHELARCFEVWLGDPVEVALIATFGPELGLKPHHDPMNLILIQVAGSKVWTFHGDPVAPGLEDGAVADELPPTREVKMNQGDVMFLPAGQRHCGHGQGFSVHLAVQLLHADGRVVREAIVQAIENDLELREPASAMLGAANDRLLAATYRTHLHALINSMNIEKLLTVSRQSRRIPKPVELKPSKRQRTMPL